MAVKRIKIGGVNYDIQDPRIAAIDTELSATSTNPVENRAINTEFSKVIYVGAEEEETTDPDFDAAADTVWNKQQSLSSVQQAQARTNINAQETLVSGTNIKTLNNESLLGSGNITINGGGGGEANIIEAITFNGVAVPVTSKTAAITATIPTVPSNVSAFSNDANYLKYVECADETAYTAITTKDNGTLYLIPVSSS